ncbi:MAG: ABC transporter substrate-binding protein [Chloroflexota bacterium]|nr:ABC transporter substrate-binding protein [Chloroflexota bacterium]
MKKTISLLGNVLLIGGLLLSACAPAAAPAPAPTSAPAPPALAPTPTRTAAATAQPPAPTLTPRAAAPTPTALASAPPPAAAAEQPRSGGILRIVGRGDLVQFDLHQTGTYQDLHPLSPIYSLLVKIDKDLETVHPDLAEKWEISPDGKTYTFYLRKGVKWHDGKPFTSADVKATYDRVLSPPKGVLIRKQEYFRAITKVETPDEYTVRLTLKYAQPSLLKMLTVPFVPIFPKHILDQKGNMSKDTMGTGPFRFKEYIRGVEFVVERNPDYFLPGKPYLDGIHRFLIRDPSTAEASFRTGRLDVLQNGEHSTLGRLRERLQKELPQMVMQKTPQYSLLAFIPNHKRKPWDDLRVRRAVMLALDREDILQARTAGEGIRGGYMPPGPWAPPLEELLKRPGFRDPTPEDRAAAKKLLAEAGYPDGFSTTLMVRSAKEYIDEAVVGQFSLAKIGITAKLDIVETGAFNTRRYGQVGEYDAMMYTAVAVEMGEPDMVFARFLPDASDNWALWRSPRFAELYTKQVSTIDPVERKKLVLEMQEIQAREVAFAGYAWDAAVDLLWPKVRNYWMVGRYLGTNFEDVWLAP